MRNEPLMSGETPAPETTTYLTAKEVAVFLKVSLSTLAKLRLSGGGPQYTKFGRRVLYAREDLITYMKEMRVQSTSEYDSLKKG